MISQSDRTQIKRVVAYERWTATRIRNIYLELDLLVADVQSGNMPEEKAEVRLTQLKNELLDMQAKTVALKYEAASGLSMKALRFIVGSLEKDK